MPRNGIEFRKSAGLAALSAAQVTIVLFVGVVLRGLANVLFYKGQHFDWHFVLIFPCVIGFIWFCVIFLYWVFKFHGVSPAVRVLQKVSAEGSTMGKPMGGFVAMEYYALILNRTFVVFIVPDGLYGWKAQGPVAADSPRYFSPYARMLEDTDLMHDLNAVRELASLRGGFVIPRSEIASVEAVHKKKWGLGRIPHSGRVVIHFVHGGRREFILLGNSDVDGTKEAILS